MTDDERLSGLRAVLDRIERQAREAVAEGRDFRLEMTRGVDRGSLEGETFYRYEPNGGSRYVLEIDPRPPREGCVRESAW